MKKADFKFLKTGLTVGFTNLSTGGPVSFVWDFGDGAVSLIPNPEHTYPYEGFFTVTLLVQYEDGTNDTAIKTMGVAEGANPLDIPLETLLKTFLPPNLDITSAESQIPVIVKKWQLFLQPLVDPEIEIVNVFSQLYWPPLVNYLIAQLTAYDLIIAVANQFLIGMMGSSGSDSTMSAGEVKMIKTGPAEVEWFQGSETWSEVFKQGGTFDQLTTQICSLSHRLRVTLYMCKELSHNTIVPRVYPKVKKLLINPFDKGTL
jgi:PKD repeat protein